MTLQVRPLAYGVGAEVLGLDLGHPLADDTIAELRDAWSRHCVLVLRGQDISPEEHIAFSARFGPLDDHANLFKYRHPECPEIFVITTRPNDDGSPSDTREVGNGWHSDASYTLTPNMGSLLLALEVPEYGGDTLFSSTYMAYETLSDTFKTMIDPLWAVHSLAHAFRESGKKRNAEATAAMLKANPAVMHPLVREHPDSGRKTIYANPLNTSHIAGMSGEESRAILDFLYRHSVRPEFTYRHRWQKHDLVMWDNRCAMHSTLFDRVPGTIRHMHRTTIRGEPSGKLYVEG
jgi:taurine dioxygenase